MSFAGAKDRSEIYQAFEQLYPVLLDFKPQIQPAAPADQEGGQGNGKEPMEAEGNTVRAYVWTSWFLQRCPLVDMGI